jgi:DNA-binding beta-propeller fold protein YncE
MLAFVGLILVMGLREPPEASRRPVALAVVDGGARVLVAASGRVAVVDVEKAEVAASWLVGEGVVDLATARDGALVLAVDGPARSLVSFTRDGTTAQRVGRVPFASEPVAVATSPDGTRAGVALRWERKVVVVEVGPDAVPRMVGAVDLPFRPGRLARLRGDVIVASDATSTALATIDLRAPRVLARVAWPGHNVGGLAASSDGLTLVVSHQTLGHLATTSFDDIHWGSTISNRLRVFRGDGLASGAPESVILEASRVVDLDEVGRASGDPGGVALGPRGETVVALSGVARVAAGPGAGPAPPFPARRIELDRGSRPTAVALSPDGTRAFVALTLDDALAVVDLTTDAAPRLIPLAPKRALDAVARGCRTTAG